jgi:hypothetical protein
MASYAQVRALIVAALSGRPFGTRVAVSAHETAEIAILDYVESKTAAIPLMRSAHATSTANVNCDLTWNTPFTNTNYDFSVNGFDASGNPVMIVRVSKDSAKITVKTMIACSLTAIATPY